MIVYSKKYRNAALKKVTLTDDYSAFTYRQSLWKRELIPLNSIYEIVQGKSNFPYVLAKAENKSWCFQLKLVGGRAIDLEATSLSDYRELFFGLENLIALYISRSPFYFDTEGRPRRASTSIIKYCVEAKKDEATPCRSEADTSRFEEALRQLKVEYDKWTAQYNAELKEWRSKNVAPDVTPVVRSRDVDEESENNFYPSNDEAVAASATPPDQARVDEPSPPIDQAIVDDESESDDEEESEEEEESESEEDEDNDDSNDEEDSDEEEDDDESN